MNPASIRLYCYILIVPITWVSSQVAYAIPTQTQSSSGSNSQQSSAYFRALEQSRKSNSSNNRHLQNTNAVQPNYGQSNGSRFLPAQVSRQGIQKPLSNSAGSRKGNYLDSLYQRAVKKQQANSRQTGRFSPGRSSGQVTPVVNRTGLNDQFHGRQTKVPARVLYDKEGKPIVLPGACTTGIPDEFFNKPGQQGARTNPNSVRQASYQTSGTRPRTGNAAPTGYQNSPRFANQQRYPTGSRVPNGQGLERHQDMNLQKRQGYRDNLRRLVRGEDLYGKQDLRSYDATPSSNHAVQPAGFNPAMYNPHANASSKNKKTGKKRGDYLNQPGPDPHADVFAGDLFPSATKCAKCHQQIFDEWASSSHAYASISPMFTRFEDTINRLAQGTVGYFCMRCHTPIGTTLGLRRDQPIWDAPRAVREGVTCVVCHHVKEITLKMNGERRVEPGTINDPVAGNSDGMGVEAALANANSLKVKVDPNDKRPGQLIHKRAFKFEELSKSTFCIACHQVAVQPGIKLEVVAEQYRASPARRQGITCQDCHMGKVPGANQGYSVGPAAVVDGKVVNPLRRHSNHMFYGPGYSVAHPGIFPHDPAQDRWNFHQWLEFDWRAGWGTEKFENDLADGKIYADFPPIWSDPDDRYDAREIVDRNLKKLNYKREIRRQVLENGSHIDGPFFTKPKSVGEPLEFNYCVSNKSPGHNMPSGSLGAQPQLWLNVVLIDPDGCRIWESGYLDSNGDLCDLHSLDVLARKIPLDKQLCNFQTKFLTTNVKGTDRENYLPVNFDFDQLPFIRPAAQPVTVINHPPFIRMEGHSIPALGSRKAKYRIPGRLLKKRGVYRLSVRLRSRAEPIYFMNFVKATPEMIKSMNEWIVDVHPYSYTFEVR